MLGKRLSITLATALFLSVGIPVWWATTAVHREHLPVEDLHLWSSKQKWPLFSQLFAEYPPGFPEKVVKASPGYRISFTLANEDPKAFLPEWDFSIIEDYFAPILSKLSVMADFTVESQVFHYASLLKNARYDAETSTHFIPADQVPNYINPNEWKQDYSATKLPILNFVIYVPNKTLKIQLSPGKYSTTNSVLIPQWGGISIYVPKAANISNNHIRLGCPELEDILPIMAAQLHELLGANHAPELSKTQYNALLKAHLSENIFTAASSILSLSKLVDSLPFMVVLEHIGALVQNSVDHLNKAHDALQKGDIAESLNASREALRTAELGFFDPSMIAQLYFPDEHKYAIYTPLFLPIVFPLLGALKQEFSHRKAKRKKQKTA